MDVILRFDVPKLGRAGQAVTVSDGYARNYLLPQDLAEAATKTTWKKSKLNFVNALLKKLKNKKHVKL